MAEAFRPRFVDLVRNYTSTTGTGNFVLGEAVAGYRSFGSETFASDSFYYSAVGIDKPAEFEVGRGTMQADGTILREPVGGTLTDFTGGTKTVALIAAAEWFEAIDAATAGGARFASTRGELAAIADRSKPAVLIEQGREGVFLFEPSDQSTNVGRDGAQGVYVAAGEDPTGASGAWVRKYSGPIEASWFGAMGDGIADDTAALQAALTFVEGIADCILRIGVGTFPVSDQLITFGAGVTIDARGATIASSMTVSLPTLDVSGDRTKILGGTWKIVSGAASTRHFDIDAVDCEIDGAFMLKEPQAGGMQAYIRPWAPGFTMRNCRTEGSNGFQLESSDSAFLFNRLKARSSGGDDAIAIKAVEKVTENIRIVGNSFENHAYFCSIGSQVGIIGTDDPTYSTGVHNVVVEGNTGTACTGILFIKPGAIGGDPGSGYDYRDGTVRGVVCSNNVLRDPTGAKFERGVALTPSRGARIIDVKGSGNVIEGRTSGSSGNLVGALDCSIVRNSTDGSAAPLIEDVDLEIAYRDLHDGTANSESVPGFPAEHIAKFELIDTSYGSMRNVALDVAGNGCAYSGVFVGENLDDAVTIRRARLTNVNMAGSLAYAGIQTRSRISVGADVAIETSAGYPYSLAAATTADVRCPELEREAYMPTVAAGNTDAQYVHSSPGRCQLIEMLEMTTVDIAASDTVYTNIQFRNKGGSNNVFHSVYTRATASGDPSAVSSGFTAGAWSSLFKLSDSISDAQLADTVFPKDAVLQHHKYGPNEGGGGRTLYNPRLKVRWAPI